MIATVNTLVGLHHMLGQPFTRHGLIAGTAIAAAAGVVGYFLVLRNQVFTADALSHVAFTGALVALTAGIDLRVGLFGATIGVALLLGALGPKGRADDVVIGSTFAWILGIGVLALSVFTASHSARNSAVGVNVLFGSIYGLDASATRTAVGIAAAVLLVMAAIGRPLLFATIDEAVAAARGLPVRGLGYIFLAVVGATAAESTQAVGALLLIGLLAAPAGVAAAVTTRPSRALMVSAGVGIGAVWGGLTLSYAAPALPPSFSILALVTAAFAGAHARRRWTDHRRRRNPVGGVLAER